MFADNDRISQRQAARQMVLTLLGPFFWLLSGRGAAGGYPELLGILLGGLLLILWIFSWSDWKISIIIWRNLWEMRQVC